MDAEINYKMNSGFLEMDFDKATDMLKDAFWCRGTKKKEVIKGAENSALVVGAFTENNKQIGYARVISDKTRFAYILDVIVDENFRKQGIGQSMVKYILNHSELRDVYQWLLITNDGHGVYQKVGFTALAQPHEWMEIRNKRPAR